MDLIVFILLALLLLTAVSGVYCFIFACVRRNEPDWLDAAQANKTPYGKYYGMIVAADQWLRSHNAQDVYVTSREGLKLHGLWIPAAEPKGTILLVHGYRSTKLVDFGLAFSYYHEMGMNILVPDQRSHGKSEGRYITFGVKESEDMICWLEYHNKELGNWQVILSGLSMGASTVLFLADKKLPENVKGIIADCGFSSPKEIISEVFKRVTHLPSVPSIWITELCARIFAGFSLYERNSAEILANNRLPLLLIHGDKDGFVPCEMSKRGYAVCTGKKQLLIVEGADHGISFLVDKERYAATVQEFLKTNLEGF